MLPIGSRSRRLSNPSTHSSVACSTASRDRHGLLRQITSALQSPMIVSARASRPARLPHEVAAVADAADRRHEPGLGEPLGVRDLGVRDRDVLHAKITTVIHKTAADRTAIVHGLFECIEHEACVSRPCHCLPAALLCAASSC
jgi:hypothetical protein